VTRTARNLNISAAAVVLTVAVCLLFACRPDTQTARGTAERFLDTHYIEINLPASKAYCTGLALHKVEEEISLTQGQVIDETTRKPSIGYRLLEEKSRGQRRASFFYEATIRVPGAGKFKKKWFLTLRRTEGVWKVSNYSESD
jgi:hypothetical protein